MIAEPNTLRCKKFQLAIPFQHLHTLYPSLAQSCLNPKTNTKPQQLQTNSPKTIMLQLIVYYTPQDKQTISYKLVKTQRLLTVLSRLSRKLKNFIPILEVVKMQHSPQKTSNKVASTTFKTNRTFGSKKQTAQHTTNPQLEYYTQKGWNIFQHYLNRHNSLIAMLRKSPQPQQQISQQLQLRHLFKTSLKQSLNKIMNITNNIPQGSIINISQPIKQQLITDIISIINALTQKYQHLIYDFVQQLRQQAENDKVVNNFLHANNKFYKIEANQKNHFQCDHSEEIMLTVNVQLAIKYLLKVVVQQNNKRRANGEWGYTHQHQHLHQHEQQHEASQHQQNHHSTQSMQQQSSSSPPIYMDLKFLNVSNFTFSLDWNLHDIQKTSLHLQSVYLYTNDKFDKLRSKLKNNQNTSHLVIDRFCNEFKQQLVYDSMEQLKIVFGIDEFEWIENGLGLEKFSLSKGVKGNKNQQESPSSSNKMKLNIQSIVFECTPNQTFQVEQQMSILNQSIQQHQNHLSTQKTHQSHPFIDQNPSILSPNQSKDLLSLFYKYYFTTIHCFIQCQKQWYFINLKVKDNNFRDRYNTMVKWIPLENNENKKGQFVKSKISDRDYSTFVEYMSSLAYTLMQVKHSSSTITKTNNQIQQTHNISTINYPKQFIYNDILNILVYDDFTFQNIQHCHYYMRNCNNDNRHHFEDRQWVQEIEWEEIKLGLKDSRWRNCKKKIDSSMLNEEEISVQQQQEQDSLRLLTIPVRGRYCRHIFFFDLSQVYPFIFPFPNSPPCSFFCPKCLCQIQFQQLIYLKQVQTLLEYIKMFYLEQDKMGINYIVKKHLRKEQKIIKQQKKDCRQGKMVKKVNKSKNGAMLKIQQQCDELYDDQYQESKYILKELDLIVDHRRQTVKLRGKYLILLSSDSQKIHSQCKQIINNNHNLNNQSYQQITHFPFEYSLPQEVYQTLLNPNKGFKSNKRLKNILFNFGKSTRNSSNQFLSKENKLTDDYLESELSFEEQIKLAHKIVSNRWQLYRDLEKGTISI